MGKDLYLIESCFSIPADKSLAAMLALSAARFPHSFIDNDQSIYDPPMNPRWFLLIDITSAIIGINLQEDAWDFHSEEDYRLFCTLAPFVADGSFIELEDSEGARWRYFFRNRKCYDQEARLVYDEVPYEKEGEEG